VADLFVFIFLISTNNIDRGRVQVVLQRLYGLEMWQHISRIITARLIREHYPMSVSHLASCFCRLDVRIGSMVGLEMFLLSGKNDASFIAYVKCHITVRSLLVNLYLTPRYVNNLSKSKLDVNTKSLPFP
jgi:hypothetical protein